MLKGVRKRFYNFRKFSQLSEYLAYWLANNCNTFGKTKFVVYAQARTGSTLMTRLLHQHPNIFCDNELLQKYLKHPAKYFDGRSLMTLKPAYGFKAMPSQAVRYLQHSSSQFLLEELYNHDWKILYLKRSNLLRHALSNIIAKQRGFFFKNGQQFEEAPKAYVPADQLKIALDVTLFYKRDEEQALKNLDFKEVVYERDMMAPEKREKCLPDICRYLGVTSDFNPEAPFLRSTTDDLADLIENMETVEQIAHEYGIEVY